MRPLDEPTRWRKGAAGEYAVLHCVPVGTEAVTCWCALAWSPLPLTLRRRTKAVPSGLAGTVLGNTNGSKPFSLSWGDAPQCFCGLARKATAKVHLEMSGGSTRSPRRGEKDSGGLSRVDPTDAVLWSDRPTKEAERALIVCLLLS